MNLFVVFIIAITTTAVLGYCVWRFFLRNYINKTAKDVAEKGDKLTKMYIDEVKVDLKEIKLQIKK